MIFFYPAVQIPSSNKHSNHLHVKKNRILTQILLFLRCKKLISIWICQHCVCMSWVIEGQEVPSLKIYIYIYITCLISKRCKSLGWWLLNEIFECLEAIRFSFFFIFFKYFSLIIKKNRSEKINLHTHTHTQLTWGLAQKDQQQDRSSLKSNAGTHFPWRAIGLYQPTKFLKFATKKKFRKLFLPGPLEGWKIAVHFIVMTVCGQPIPPNDLKNTKIECNRTQHRRK